MNHKLLLPLLLCACITAQAQTFNYKPLKAQGEIPEDFTSRYSEKVEIEVEKIKHLSGKALKKELKYHAYNEFIVDAYLTSGKVVYGDELSIYLNDVLEKVLAKDKVLRDEMRVYAVRDADFNAYTTSKGIIFVNMGLLSQLATEAQLAYVLAHEVVHYANNHVRENYDFKKTVSKSGDEYGYDVDRMAKAYYDFSKENELEADKEGYETYFAHTGYSKLAPFELMDIMLYSYLPFDEIEFDVNIFNTSTYGLASVELREFAAKEISAREDVSDSMSTHPNIKVRTEAIEDFLALKKEGSDFLVSEERFNALREQARFESLDDFLTSARYDRAIYQAFLLLQTYPNDDYLKRAIVYAVYGSSVYKNYNSLPPNIENMDGVEGELSRVRYILKNIDEESLNTLAVAMSHEFYSKHPDDKLAKRIYEDAVWELTHYHEKQLSFYDVMPELAQTDTAAVVEEEIELNTTGKVKRLKKKQIDSSIMQTKYAFSAYLADSVFTTYFTKMADAAAIYPENNLPKLATRTDNTGTQQSLKDIRTKEQLPYGSFYVYPEQKENVGGKGVKNVLAITPESYTLQQRGSAINFKKSEEGGIDYVEKLQSSSKNLGVNLELFDYKYVTDADADRFNELQTLQLWYDEHTNHSKMGIVHYMFSRVDPICDKYETDYLLYTGVLNLTNRGLRNYDGMQRMGMGYLKVILSGVFLPAAPFIIGAGYVPSYTSYQFVRVLNLRTDKVVLSRSNEFDQLRTNSVQNGLIYNQLNELSSKPKYKN